MRPSNVTTHSDLHQHATVETGRSYPSEPWSWKPTEHMAPPGHPIDPIASVHPKSILFSSYTPPCGDLALKSTRRRRSFTTPLC
jgi:hypothetical protein